jgi:plasmid stability protein
MKRALIQLDDETYDKLRHRAFERKQSISAVVREFVVTGLDGGKRRKFSRLEDFRSIASGGSRQGKEAPVSEKHDAALAEAYRRSNKK